MCVSGVAEADTVVRAVTLALRRTRGRPALLLQLMAGHHANVFQGRLGSVCFGYRTCVFMFQKHVVHTYRLAMRRALLFSHRIHQFVVACRCGLVAATCVVGRQQGFTFFTCRVLESRSLCLEGFPSPPLPIVFLVLNTFTN